MSWPEEQYSNECCQHSVREGETQLTGWNPSGTNHPSQVNTSHASKQQPRHPKRRHHTSKNSLQSHPTVVPTVSPETA
jgi:hypothetical protein